MFYTRIHGIVKIENFSRFHDISYEHPTFKMLHIHLEAIP